MTNLVPSLEWCKKLKEWGSPQDTHFSYTEKLTGGCEKLSWKGKVETRDRHFLCAAPTLQELIEWLGDGFALFHIDLTEEEAMCAGGANGWVAEVNDFGSNKGRCPDEYETPLEAVLNLAEALHGKENND